MLDQRQVEIGHRRQAELQHDLPLNPFQSLENFGLQQRLGLRLVRDRDRDFRLQDRHQPMRRDLPPDGKLLCHDAGNSGRIGGIDHRPLLGPEDARRRRPLQQVIQAGDRLHQLNAVNFGLQPLVNLQERHHAALFPQVGRGRDAVDHPVHGLFKQDRADHLVAGKGGRLDDPGAHRMDQVEHRLVAGIVAFRNPVQFQGLGGRSARLVQRRDKAASIAHLFGHLRVGHVRLPNVSAGIAVKTPPLNPSAPAHRAIPCPPSTPERPPRRSR